MSIDAGTPTSTIVAGICTYLDSLGLGQYATGSRVFDGLAPALSEMVLPDTPDRAIAVAVYNREVPVNPHEGSWVALLQIRGRAEADSSSLLVADMLDGVRAVLNGLHHATLGDVNVARVGFTYSADLGRDANGRQEQTDNYRLVLQ